MIHQTVHDNKNSNTKNITSVNKRSSKTEKNTINMCFNHDSTDVSPGVSSMKKIELEFEQDVIKTDYKT